VANWPDGINGIYTATSAAGSRPIFKTNVQNGRPVVRFSAFQFFTMASPLSAVGPLSVFAVYNKPQAGRRMIVLGHDGGVAGPYPTIDWLDGFLYHSLLRADNTCRFLAVARASGWQCITSFGGATGDPGLRRNGTALTGTVGNDTRYSDTWSFIGRRFNDPTDGDIAEIVCYKALLDDTDKTFVESYLMTKWGI